jgi:hypothetical protein
MCGDDVCESGSGKVGDGESGKRKIGKLEIRAQNYVIEIFQTPSIAT